MDKRSKIFVILGGAAIAAALLFFVLSSNKSPSEVAMETPASNPEANAKLSLNPIAMSKPQALSNEEQAKLQTLDEILKSKNDNDPRLDQLFQHLSTGIKLALEKRYQDFAREDRNGRGTIVFLISREITSTEDIQFLKSVYEEAPCTNMDGCSAAPSNDPHHSGVENTSLNYPQLVGLYQIERTIRNNPQAFSDSAQKAALLDLLSKAKLFPVQSVQNRASTILSLLAAPTKENP